MLFAKIREVKVMSVVYFCFSLTSQAVFIDNFLIKISNLCFCGLINRIQLSKAARHLSDSLA
jgi:hypothetical protein